MTQDTGSTVDDVYNSILKKSQYQEIKGWQLMYKGEMSLFIPSNSQQHYLSIFLHYTVGLCLPSTSPADRTCMKQNKGGEWCLAKLPSHYWDLQKHQPRTPQCWTSGDQSVKWSQSSPWYWTNLTTHSQQLFLSLFIMTILINQRCSLLLRFDRKF